MNWFSWIIASASVIMLWRAYILRKSETKPESEHPMSEPDNTDVPPVGLADILSSLRDDTENKIEGVLDLNRDIVLATRKMAHNILKLRQAHIEEAERLYSIASDLIDSAVVSSTIAADLIDVEFGGELFDPKQFLDNAAEDEDDD